MSDAGTGDGGTAQFKFQTQGLIVNVDDQDNPNNHVGANLFDDAGTKVSFAIGNVGAVAGAADVTVSVDGNQVQTWTSQSVEPNNSTQPDGDGFVHGCGRFAAGDHAFSATVGLSGSGNTDDTATNNVSVSAASSSDTGTPAPGGDGTPTPSPGS